MDRENLLPIIHHIKTNRLLLSIIHHVKTNRLNLGKLVDWRGSNLSSSGCQELTSL